MLKLTDQEKKVLSVVHMQADLSLEQVQRETGMRADSVRYALKRLRDRELVHLNPVIDLYRLGYTHYGLFFSLSSESSDRYSRFIAYLRSSPTVSFVSELGGDYQLTATLCVQDAIEVEEFLADISERFGNIFFQKLIAIRTSFTEYRVKFLLGHDHDIKRLERSTTRERYTVDELDHRILSCVSNKMLLSTSAIAREIGAAYSTVEGRVRKLREKKIIVGYRYMLNNQSLGIQTYLLLVYVKGLPREFKERFESFCVEHENIRYKVESMGGWDYELGIQAYDSKRASFIAQEIQHLFKEYVSLTRILPVFSYLKVNNYPFHVEE